jgi:SAM-dependent methyltransferase
MIDSGLYKRFYPDQRHDGTMRFYQWVREALKREMTLLNLGAGPASGSAVRSFRGQVARVIGADIDPIVMTNDELDEGYVISGGKLPLGDESIDVVVSDYVLEHVSDPASFMSEVHRVLRSGGQFFFRTPNAYHYVSIIAKCTPYWFHDMVANRARALAEQAHEPYPTYHRLNTRRAISRAARVAGFERCQFIMFEGQPSYLVFATIPFVLGVGYERLVNRFESLSWLRSNVFGNLTK